MVDFIESDKKMTVKIVYYGPALSGKTTNLMHLHEVVNPTQCGELMSMETKGDRTLFFDLLPLALKTKSGFQIKFKLFTVPGQVAHDATRKAVLSRSDGVVFVADSQKTQSVNNYESFENLEKNAKRTGLDFETLPLVVQFNKRDLGSVISEREVNQLWEPSGIPIVFSTAIKGEGVVETFEEILKLTYVRLNTIYGLERNHGVTQGDFLNIIVNPEHGNGK